MGIAFMGHQDKNLVQAMSTTYSGYSFSQSYSYQYDSQNRVITTTITSNGTIDGGSSYIYKQFNRNINRTLKMKYPQADESGWGYLYKGYF